jgi:hypothetical protein
VKIDRSVKFLLLVIAIATSAIALRPYIAPAPVKAQTNTEYPFFIEPGTANLRSPDGRRNEVGKVMVDMRNGNVWGFPTNTPDPYPFNPTSSSLITSHPFLLGKFALSDMNRMNQ